VFERFTERARMVVVLAQEKAVRFGHDYIGTEHLLLGLTLEREGATARALSSLGVDKKVRSEAMSMLGADRAAVAHEVDRSSSMKDTQPVKVRTKVKALDVNVHRGVSAEERALPQTLLVDLEYVYEAQGDDDISPGWCTTASSLRELCKSSSARSPNFWRRGLREHVLKVLPEVRQVAVSVTKPQVPVSRTVYRV
jgi:dihydroneopterin aldolase